MRRDPARRDYKYFCDQPVAGHSCRRAQLWRGDWVMKRGSFIRMALAMAIAASCMGDAYGQFRPNCGGEEQPPCVPPSLPVLPPLNPQSKSGNGTKTLVIGGVIAIIGITVTLPLVTNTSPFVTNNGPPASPTSPSFGSPPGGPSGPGADGTPNQPPPGPPSGPFLRSTFNQPARAADCVPDEVIADALPDQIALIAARSVISISGPHRRPRNRRVPPNSMRRRSSISPRRIGSRAATAYSSPSSTPASILRIPTWRGQLLVFSKPPVQGSRRMRTAPAWPAPLRRAATCSARRRG